MNSQKFYLKTIKNFIIGITLLSQCFLFLTITTSYMYYKRDIHNQLTDYQQQHYVDSLNTLSLKFSNLQHLLVTSDAADLCTTSIGMLSEPELQMRYTLIQEQLDTSYLLERYFAGYCMSGLHDTNFAFYNLNGVFCDASGLRLESQSLFDSLLPNEFNIRLNNVFLFNDQILSSFNPPHAETSVYEQFIKDLSHRYVYYTTYGNLFYLFIINDSLFENIFATAKENHTSIVLQNSLGDIIYSNFYYDDADEFKEYQTFRKGVNLEENNFILHIRHHMPFTYDDISFILFVAFICCFVILLSVFLANYYSRKILEPYSILNNFFHLNSSEKDIEPFDYSKFIHSIKKRSDISSNCFRAAVFSVIIPSLMTLLLLFIPTKQFMQHMSDSLLSVAHTHLKNEFYDNIDHFLMNVSRNSDDITNTYARQNYYVLIGKGNTLPYNSQSSHNFVSLTHFSDFQHCLRSFDLTKKNILYNIDKDLFGDHALGIVTPLDDGSYRMDIIKSTTLENAPAYDSINYMILDADNHVVTQNIILDDSYRQRLIDGSAKAIVHKSDFEELGWTLYTFSSNEAIYRQANFIMMLDFIIILAILLCIIIIAWRYSIFFVRPLAHVMSLMTNEDTPSENSISAAQAENNEIYEMFYLYNQMIMHIREVTNEKILLLKNEERLKTQIYRAELIALQQQINPHFLSNTLEIASLSAMKHQDFDTSRIISRLSRLLQYSFRKTNTPVLLCDELENIRTYMDIWKLRFPNRFEYFLEIDPEAEAVSTLKLILQPIVENCFLHGFKDKNENCVIRISVELLKEHVTITIQDNGHGMSQEALSGLCKKLEETSLAQIGHGIGVANVFQRLRIYYHDEAHIYVTSTLSEGTTVTLHFPAFMPSSL